MGVHKHWHAFPAHSFTPAEFHGTGSTGEDESPCGTIESVKMANGRSDLVDLITVYRRRKNGGVTRVRWVPGPRTGSEGLHGLFPSLQRAPLRLFLTVADRWPVVFLSCHTHARFLSQHLQRCGEPEA